MKNVMVLLIMVILTGCTLLNAPPYGGEDEAWWTREVIKQGPNTQMANAARGKCKAHDWDCAREVYRPKGGYRGTLTLEDTIEMRNRTGYRGEAIERVLRERRTTLINDCLNSNYGCAVPLGD